MSRVNRLENGCWEWTGSIGQKGYGRINSCRKIKYAHRMFYEKFVGPVPDGLEVMHSCDNPACVNPDHLEAGTHKKNMQDASKRGRMNSMKGEENPSSVLTDSQVAEIYTNPNKNKRGFVFRTAKAFGINRGTVYCILDGSKWGHVTKLLQ